MTTPSPYPVDVYRAYFVGAGDSLTIRIDHYDGIRKEDRVAVLGGGSFSSDEYLPSEIVNFTEAEALAELRRMVEGNLQNAEEVLAQAKQKESILAAREAEVTS